MTPDINKAVAKEIKTLNIVGIGILAVILLNAYYQNRANYWTFKRMKQQYLSDSKESDD